MPIYEYKCLYCNETSQVAQKFNDPILKTCPLCCKEALIKLISKTDFSLKGPNWYKDGYTKPKSN